MILQLFQALLTSDDFFILIAMKQLSDHELKKLKTWLSSGSINIFGLPFAGKDTLAHNLSVILGAHVISGGDILRTHDDQATIKKLMSTGELFPSDYYLGITIPFISQERFQNQPLILSSLGRMSGEEVLVMRACETAMHPMKAVVHLHVPTETVWKRFKVSQDLHDRDHRHDNADHILEIRLNEFHSKTQPVIEYYRKNALLIEVDGRQKIEDTTSTALSALYKFSEERTTA